MLWQWETHRDEEMHNIFLTHIHSKREKYHLKWMKTLKRRLVYRGKVFIFYIKWDSCYYKKLDIRSTRGLAHIEYSKELVSPPDGTSRLWGWRHQRRVLTVAPPVVTRSSSPRPGSPTSQGRRGGGESLDGTSSFILYFLSLLHCVLLLAMT